MITKKEVNAIEENDFEAVIEKLGLSEKYNNNQLLCSKCGCVITKTNIAFIYCNTTYTFICDNPDCSD
jgi:hypothetical protein